MLIKKASDIPSSEITSKSLYMDRRKFITGPSFLGAAMATVGCEMARPSKVIPWVGYSLSNLINQLQPTSKAKYVMFTTLMDMGQFPGQRAGVLDWPYTEGLRMDEAMHPLTLLTFGLYGETLPNQDGAPVRIVVPWKYGFKSIKSIVKIDFVDYEPPTAWNKAAPNEYGFYSNVNPNVDHPRWSQATERRIGEFRKRQTLMFNGYSDQVASLYTGMDLKKHF